MCGGFVMAYSSAKIDPAASAFSQFIAHLMYNVGRVSSYTLLGMIFGAIGSIFTFSARLNGYLDRKSVV